ncbi:hypothetical protein RHS04_01368 [Rhizoctonia solani]|uniref:Uncharacterized protein n=1 Tax=Rhizoctonia solani TaxID=456999 RepID=A0A8H7HDD6_9AGAM|nr:hypothetical protein RHS04_01368 [Rhizoctonia solani]
MNVASSMSLGRSAPAAIELPDELKLYIARELYNNSVETSDHENMRDLVSLSMSSKSWRLASLPYVYSHCGIGGRGNFAAENWLNRILPRYGHFVRSIDISLCWIHSNHLPEQERESMELEQRGSSSPWENARDDLVAQLIANLTNLSTIKLTMLLCVVPPGLSECSCVNRFGTAVQAFEGRDFQSMSFHGIATAFCPRLARAVFIPSANSLRSICFGDEIDGCPSLNQPFDSICQLPALTRASFAAASFHAHSIESLPWPLSVEQISTFLRNFSSSLQSFVLHDVAINQQVGAQSQPLPDLPCLVNLALQSTRNSTFRTLNILEAHLFEHLSITVTPAVEPSPLLNTLSKGAFPKLKTIEICFSPRNTWATPARWDSSSRIAIQKACDARFIKLTVFENKRQEHRAMHIQR